MKARVNITAVTSFSIRVEVPDDLDTDEAREAAIDAAYDHGVPGLCAYCSGWRQNWSRDEGEYEVIEGPEAVEFDG